MNADNRESAQPPRPDALGWAETDSLNTTYVYVEPVGDSTIRPMRSPVLRQIRPEQRPSSEKSDGN